jgi:glycosyltransferase involved in cell wall biosynthesis
MAVHAYYEKDARVRRYAEALVQAGHEVDVLALRDPGRPRREILHGVQVIRLPLARRRGGVARYVFEYCMFFALVLWGLIWLHRRRRYRVVHIHNMPDLLVFAAMYPKLCGARVVLDIHDLMPEVYSSKFQVPISHRAIWPLRVQERWSMWFADRVVFASDLFREIAVARGSVHPDKAISVLNAADIGIFDRARHPWVGPGSGRFVVLYLGTVSERHGVDQAVRAVARIKGQVPGLRFEIYPRFAEGDGRPLEELRRLVSEQGLSEIVEFLPPVPLEEVPAVMSRASVGVFTPHLDVHIDIALSLKVPEYTAMGLPIVTTRTRIMERYFHSDEVAFFQDGDVQGCAEALLRQARDPEGGRAMAERAGRFLREHSWEQERDRYFAMLSGLCPDVAGMRGPRRAETRPRELAAKA